MYLILTIVQLQAGESPVLGKDSSINVPIYVFQLILEIVKKTNDGDSFQQNTTNHVDAEVRCSVLSILVWHVLHYKSDFAVKFRCWYYCLLYVNIPFGFVRVTRWRGGDFKVTIGGSHSNATSRSVIGSSSIDWKSCAQCQVSQVCCGVMKKKKRGVL